ncbi:primosomal protein N' [Novimethylophilus kurashikiensis]|uniref:Replication restart protein PriA n=1 Tax=Novimethylophilus kurashikiensis TaxID=1825523 RepID=A0A2R5FAT2_9PROT|nr:primosomal protein N' [Novimethylophilus kurashikiensis]GBG13744.1 primosomal protein N' [Novimethylophilus kurashikiensis]
MSILRVALDVPLDTLFDYLDAGHQAEVGMRVLVPFGRRQMVGVVLEIVEQSQLDNDALKPVLEVYGGEPTLSSEILRLLNFCADYYHYPLGQIVMSVLPGRLREARLALLEKILGYRLSELARQASLEVLPKRALIQRRLWLALEKQGSLTAENLGETSDNWHTAIKAMQAAGWVECVELKHVIPSAPSAIARPALNEDQAAAVEAVTRQLTGFKAWLLHGITGSGKTEVYMRLLESALAAPEAQVLVLVPEINLTPQLQARFKARFPHEPMVALHSQMSDGERLRNWRQAESGLARIVIGTRLSVFTPIPNLKLVVVDEEHDGSYKQQDGMRYSARDVAVVRAKQAGIPIVLGSATPSLETWHNSQAGRYALLTLGQRAVAQSQLPDIITLDARTPQLKDGLTPALINALHDRLAKGEQSLLFINRRGYSPVLLCSACAWVAPCERCSSRLVVHLRQRRLKCHHCGHEERIHVQCPNCGNPDLHPTGHGTQRLEATLAELFPEARVLRVDRDSTRRKGALEDMMAEVHGRRVDILVGTQMLAKGHDFPNLTLVGIIDTDSALFSPDFRAAERLFAQLMQVAGRAGRAEKPGEVLIQTAFPDHVLFEALKRHDYAAFATTLLQERKTAMFPPYCFQALLRAEAQKFEPVRDFIAEAANIAYGLDGAVMVYDPVRPTMARLNGMERAQLLVQAEHRQALQAFLKQWMGMLRSLPLAAKVRWSLDVDPLEI